MFFKYPTTAYDSEAFGSENYRGGKNQITLILHILLQIIDEQ